MDVNQQTSQLIEAIKASPEYTDYLNHKYALEREPELYQKVQEFRKKCFVIQVEHRHGMYEAFEQLNNLKREYAETIEMARVKMFLDSELSVSNMISKIITTISEEIDLDISFLS